MIEIDPLAIKVREGLERYRKDMGAIQDLAESIKKNGQIQPIVINGEKELIDGGRRTAACIYAGIKVKAIYRKDIDSNDKMRLIEILANIERKSFTPAEEELAIAELHRIKLKEAGMSEISSPGRAAKTDGNTAPTKAWNMEKTAKLLGISKMQVSRSLQNAEIIKRNPELKNAKTKGEIKNKGEKAERIETAKANIAKMELILPGVSVANILNIPAAEFLSTIKPGTVDIIITDPPYMIDVDQKRSISSEIDGYSDSQEVNSYVYNDFIKQLVPTLTEKGCLYMFIGTEYFQHFKTQLEEEGMRVYWKEIIWIKGTSGQTNQPSMNPGDCYEKILYARKPLHRLVREGMPNWIQCDPVAKKTHQAEKPVPLITNLLTRSAFPGQTLIDPFCGSGAILEAASRFKMHVSGCDINPDFVALAKERVLKNG